MGMHDPQFWENGEKGTEEKEQKCGKMKGLPINHSPFFAPVIQPTLKASVDAMALGALTFVAKDS
jgi:hypothetical protein